MSIRPIASWQFYRPGLPFVPVLNQERLKRFLFHGAPMYYYLYQDVNRQWRWTLYAANNLKIANSGEGYFNKSDCLNAISLVKGSFNAPVKE